MSNRNPPALRQVQSIENQWIPMADGVRLAARIWLPEDAEQRPVPALLDYIPYRKRDFSRLRDESTNTHFAAHGYACIRVDIRGSGDSEGLPQDEYVKQEQDDGLEIIAWIARQSWCTGKVGMHGISWGGCSAIQVAARQPPALKAIITLCSTDDRYTDGDQWMGGCIGETFFTWGAYATLIGARPPDVTIVGERWRDMWRQRVENLDFYVGNWLSHPHKDDFWKHASISADYNQVQCAVYAMGGWSDHYCGTIARMMARLECPRKGLIGPWNHAFPHIAPLGPTIDWLSEALRWWDYWLKDVDTGIMDEPMLRAWMQYEPATQGMRQVPGRWIAEDSWPSSNFDSVLYYLDGTGLAASPGPDLARTLVPLQTVGITAPVRYYRSDGLGNTLPTDQRVDDARSMLFDSPALTEDIEILGAPVATLDVSVDRPVAFLAVRLTEVEPSGISKRIAFAVLNLTHRTSSENPEPLIPGERIRVRIPLHDCAYRFKAGCRIRLSISTTYWPAFWPSPEPVMLTVFTGAAVLALPRRHTRPEDASLRPFGPGFVPGDSGQRTIVPASAERKLYEWDVEKRMLTIRSSGDGGKWVLSSTDTQMTAAWSEVTEISDTDPETAQLKIWMRESFSRPGWDVRVESTLILKLTKSEFLLSGQIECFDAGALCHRKSWNRTINRNLL